MREKIIEKGCKNAKKVIDRMKGSYDLSDVAEIISITKNLSLEIDCIRADLGDDECDPLTGFKNGTPLFFELYVIKGDETVDGITSDIHSDILSDVKYLLNCCVD